MELSAHNKDKLRALDDMAEETTGLLTRSQTEVDNQPVVRHHIVRVCSRTIFGESEQPCGNCMGCMENEQKRLSSLSSKHSTGTSTGTRAFERLTFTSTGGDPAPRMPDPVPAIPPQESAPRRLEDVPRNSIGTFCGHLLSALSRS
jgi:hypothetical protein